MQLAKESTRESTEEAEILKLASSQRMNTDTRRSIFCIIMGSEDCDDAFEKLVRAGMLKNRTERDTVRVLTECCGNEKTFNPFYAHLASRICDYQQQCKFTFQLSFWDTFKQFDSLKPPGWQIWRNSCFILLLFITV
jgi:nucleolar MIF4G domain-containing protein 1